MTLSTPSGIGEAASLAAALIWGGSMTAFAAYGKGLAPHNINLFKSVVAIAAMLLTLLVLGTAIPDRPEMVVLLVLSGVIGIAIGDTLLFMALQSLGPTLTGAIQCISPAATAIIAYYALNESLSELEIKGMALTLTSVAAAVLLSQRSIVGGINGWGVFWAVLSAIANAIGMVMTREAIQHVDSLWGSLSRMVGGALFLYFLGRFFFGEYTFKRILSKPKNAVALGLSSFAGTYVAVWLCTIGTKYAKVGVATAISFSYPLWVIPISAIFLKERVGLGVIVCMVLACAGIAMMVL